MSSQDREDGPDSPDRDRRATIDVPLARRLIATQFPHWADREVTPVERSGVDNATYRLGDDLLMRLPRFARWVGQVEREQTWLPRLAPHLPLPIPVPEAEGVPGEGYPFPWSVYRWLPGRAADPARIPDLVAAARTLAGFFRALQAVDPAGGPPPEWSNGFRGAALADERDSPAVESRIRDRIAALEGLTDTDALTAVYETARAAPAWERPPVWIHGDPAPGNLLTEGGKISAVIDFGTLAVGDPACDLIVAWTLLDAPGRAAFRAELEIDDATWARGRAWGLTGTLPSPEDYTHPERGPAERHRLEAVVADHRASA